MNTFEIRTPVYEIEVMFGGSLLEEKSLDAVVYFHDEGRVFKGTLRPAESATITNSGFYFSFDVIYVHFYFTNTMTLHMVCGDSNHKSIVFEGDLTEEED